MIIELAPLSVSMRLSVLSVFVLHGMLRAKKRQTERGLAANNWLQLG
jgi:hypothetical protein